jgi:hypothetical protein
LKAIEDGSKLHDGVNDQRAIDSVGMQTFPSWQQVAANLLYFSDVVDCNLRRAAIWPIGFPWNRGNGIRACSARDSADQSVHTPTWRGMVRRRNDAVFCTRRRLRSRSSEFIGRLGVELLALIVLSTLAVMVTTAMTVELAYRWRTHRERN